MCKEEEKESCSLCKRDSDQYKNSVSESDIVICSDCLDILSNTMDETKKDNFASVKSMSAKKIKENLDKYLMGQEDAKKVISIASANHIKKINNPGLKFNSSNILLVGDTGTGKTYMVETLAKIIGVDFYSTDATTYTEAGYHGDDVESIIKELFIQNDHSKERTERSIVFIDEIDKLSKNPSKSEANTKGVQQALLKLIEGKDITMRKHSKEDIKISTKNIMFIFAGSFRGIETLVKSRANPKQQMGFTPNKETKKTINYKINNNDLNKFGLIKEFIGRLTSTTILNKLDKKTLKKILLKKEDSLINQYKDLFDLVDTEIDFEKCSIQAIINKSYEHNTGARSLKTIIDEALEDIMFEMPEKSIIKITKEVINNKEYPSVIRESKYN